MIFNSLRVYLTEQCNAKCPSCFNRESRNSASMDKVHFEQICRTFSEKGVKRLKIMGGEPTMHPHFAEMIEMAQQFFPNIFLFTNAINDKIIVFNTRTEDSIIYNFTFHKLWDRERLLLNHLGRRSFEIQIRPNSNEKEIVAYLDKLSDFEFTAVLTLDCTSNIFKDRKILISKIEFLQNHFSKKGISFSMDHRLPLCFLYGSNIIVPTNNFSKCSLSCSCLIDAEYNLRFCNQSKCKTINVFFDDKIIPIQILENHLRKEFYLRQINNLDNFCGNCVFYESMCNGGCFLNNGTITKKDILNATQFPTI